MSIHAMMHLMRFNKPIGTLLLWYPTAWALWLANHGQPPTIQVVYFFIGTVLMRSAGCVFNDITDRNIDLHVDRTAQRPLATNAIGLPGAFGLLLALLISACGILVQLPSNCFPYALLAVFITGLYPFAKRFIHAPQVILGLAFSMGIPMVYAAAHVTANLTLGLLMCVNFCWIVAYDTVYALNDRKDDRRIGVHSTALWFGDRWWQAVCALSLFSHILWLWIALINQLSSWFYLGWTIGLGVMCYQLRLITQQRQYPRAWLRAFALNGWYGFILMCAVIIGFIR